jgi:hypothetical protein
MPQADSNEKTELLIFWIRATFDASGAMQEAGGDCFSKKQSRTPHVRNDDRHYDDGNLASSRLLAVDTPSTAAGFSPIFDARKSGSK